MSKNNLATNYDYDGERYEEAPHVRRAYIPPDLTYETMSELGKELYELSMEIAESGEGLLTEEELERELARRRGGYLMDALHLAAAISIDAEFISAEKPTKPIYQAWQNVSSIY